MKTDRVVLDVNIFVSLILKQQVEKLVEWYKDDQVTIYTCPELLAELEDVLTRPEITHRCQTLRLSLSQA